MFEDDATVFTAMRAGARGHVLQDDDKVGMLGAIRTVGRGGAVFGPGVAARLTDFLTTARSAVPRGRFPALTDREREMVHLNGKGSLQRPEIARLLSLSPKTVANYVSNILHKLQVADRKEAMIRAREAGLGQDPLTGGDIRDPANELPRISLLSTPVYRCQENGWVLRPAPHPTGQNRRRGAEPRSTGSFH